MYTAETLLIHYIRLAWEAAGLHWDSDNEAEVGAIIDCIKEEVKRELKED